MANKLSEISCIKLSDYHVPWDIIIEKVERTTDFPFHWHEHYELEYILAGSGTHTVNGKSHPMRAGNLHFIVPTDFHELHVDTPLTMIKIVFDESSISQSVFDTLKLDVNLTNLTLTEKERAQFEALFVVSEGQAQAFEGSQHYTRISKNLLECLLLNLSEIAMRILPSNAESEESESDIHEVLVYLRRNFKKPISLSTVAEYSHFSTSHLSRLFHKTMGVTFKEYLTELRMNFAAKCLQNTDASVTEICYEAGFGSLSGFITEFRRRFGLSPTAYKREQRENEAESRKK